MSETEFDPPLTLREKFAANDALARLKAEKRLERSEEKGFLRAQLLPFLMAGALIFGLFYGLYARVMRPMKDLKRETGGLYPYDISLRAYRLGSYEAAAKALQPLLDKNPSASEAYILMARIQFARGHRPEALECLKRARENSLDYRQIDRWIADLESPLSPPSGSKSTLPGN